jgi:hypothetical protein
MSIICPVCRENQFSQEQKGIILKYLTHRCLSCDTRLKQTGKGDDALFSVIRVGKNYSNCDPLFKGWQENLPGLQSHDLPVYPDAQLLQFSIGEISEDYYQNDAEMELPFELDLDEQLVFALGNVYAWEDRLNPEMQNTGIRPKVEPGNWFKIKPLTEPRFAHQTETLAVGSLFITSMRYYFEGKSREIGHIFTKITSLTPYRNGMAISSPERLRNEFFKGYYHWPLITSISRGLIRNSIRRTTARSQ